MTDSTKSHLFAPLRLRNITARNRIFISPMCQYSAVDGVPGEWHMIHLGSRAVGGAGLVMAEATAVLPEGRISPADTGLWTDEQEKASSKIAAFVRGAGAVPAIQLAHAGRKASTDLPWRGGKPLAPGNGGWEVVAPSPIPFDSGYSVPHELTGGEIDRIVAAFRAAAERAVRAGFQAIEIHAAHGYLLHEFLSPLSNRRGDEYGGSSENRMRLVLRVARELRDVCGEGLPLFVRISATDWAEQGGWEVTQSIELAKRLREEGVDLVDCSSGGMLAHAHVPVGPGYQVPFAEAIRREAGIATGAVGLITEAAQAEEILVEGRADAVLIARASLNDPYWPLHAAHALGIDVDWPDQYLRGRPKRL